MFVLIVDPTTTIRGIAEEVSIDALKKAFGEIAIISGTAFFHPSGTIQRIEADSIELAKGDVSVWSTVPKPLGSEIDLKSLHKPQGARSGLNAIFGQWPGDEPDEKIMAVLEEIS
jgi:hypothetical protein